MFSKSVSGFRSAEKGQIIVSTLLNTMYEEHLQNEVLKFTVRSQEMECGIILKKKKIN